MAISSLNLCTWSSLYMCLWVQIFPFYKDTGHIRISTHPNELTLTNYICNNLFPKKVTFWGLKYWKLRLQHMNLVGYKSIHSRREHTHSVFNEIQSWKSVLAVVPGMTRSSPISASLQNKKKQSRKWFQSSCEPEFILIT